MSHSTYQYRGKDKRDNNAKRGTKRERELTPIEQAIKFPKRYKEEDRNATICVFPITLLKPQQTDFDNARQLIAKKLVSKLM